MVTQKAMDEMNKKFDQWVKNHVSDDVDLPESYYGPEDDRNNKSYGSGHEKGSDNCSDELEDKIYLLEKSMKQAIELKKTLDQLFEPDPSNNMLEEYVKELKSLAKQE